MRRTLLSLVALVCVACTARAQQAPPSATPAPTPTPVPVEHPLTGALSHGPQDWQQRPVLAVKIDNSRGARPQAGLDTADVVYEELAEGGISRFIALFHSQGAATVGPVRSARRADPEVIAAYSPLLFAYSGGIPQALAAVRRQQGFTDVGYDTVTGAYDRVAGRKAPHNLFTSTAALWRAKAGPPPSSPAFAFAPQGAATSAGTPASGVSFSFSQEPVGYAYQPESGTYRRTQGGVDHTVEGGGRIAPVNVVIQFVAVRSSNVRDTNGQYTQESVVVGGGDLLVLTNGRAIRGRWERAGEAEHTRYLDAAGQPIELGRGQTWVELLPADRPVRLS